MFAALVVIAALSALCGSSLAATYKVLYTFTGYSDGALPQGTLIFDDQGNLYGTTTGGGAYGGGTVFGLSPSSDGTTVSGGMDDLLFPSVGGPRHSE